MGELREQGAHGSAAVREPVVLRDLDVEPKNSSVTKLSDLLAKELRDNIDLVLKLAVFSIMSTATVLVLLLALVCYLTVR